ncbi:MAG: DUF4347 domain-containing protein [Planctomycetes bacterium]|nr:DUF4347 domain-containing protein [Planctomycetota bacterium]
MKSATRDRVRLRHAGRRHRTWRDASRAPLGYVEGMNLYEYVGSNPANLTDPTGLCGGTAPDEEDARYQEYLAEQGAYTEDQEMQRYQEYLAEQAGATPQVGPAAGAGTLVLTGPNGEIIVVRNDGTINAGGFSVSGNAGSAAPAPSTAGQGGTGRRFIVYSKGEGLLTAAWAVGAFFSGDTAIPAGSVSEMVAKIHANLKPGETIESIRIWGHGNIGAMYVGADAITVEDFAAKLAGLQGSDYSDLAQLRDRMAPSPNVCFSGCLTLRTEKGAEFAQEAASFFGGTVGGYTGLVGYSLSWDGYAEVRPGEAVSYPTSGAPYHYIEPTMTNKIRLKLSYASENGSVRAPSGGGGWVETPDSTRSGPLMRLPF